MTTTSTRWLAFVATAALAGAGNALAQGMADPAQPPPEATPKPPSTTGADAAVARAVQDQIATIVGGIDATEAALTRVNSLAAERSSNVKAVRRQSDLAWEALRRANAGCDKLDDMKDLSPEAETQVRAIEQSLHDARDLVSLMRRESAGVNAPFAIDDADRVREQSSQAHVLIGDARAAAALLARAYDIALPETTKTGAGEP